MNEEKVIAFQNTNDYPVSFFIKGIRNKVFLDKGHRILTREGVPILPPETEWSWLIGKGIKPVYLKTQPEALRPLESDRNLEVVLDDLKLLEAKLAAKPQTLIEEMITPLTMTPDGLQPVNEAISHLEDPNNPDPIKADLIWQTPDGLWIFNKDGVRDINPAVLKKHIRKKYGKEYLERVEWRSFGSAPVEAAPTDLDGSSKGEMVP